MRSYSRRGFLGLAAAGATAAMLSTLGRVPARVSNDAPPTEERSGAAISSGEAELRALIDASTEATTIARPVRSELMMMEATRYATPVSVLESGQPGPVVMVLGGIHGNEPGGWRAAEQMVGWNVARGSLIVAPRVNHLSADVFRRTSPELGDLNRLYPGDPNGLPMERMAHQIVELARRYSVTHLFDLHESWGFYRDRAPGNRSVSTELGQLVIVGGERSGTDLLATAAADVNTSIAEREEFIVYDRSHPDWTWIGLGRSSISLAAHIEGCTPILVETAQNGQTEERRAELHCKLVAATLAQLGMTAAAPGPAPTGAPAGGSLG